jgi:hypothetical protein
MRGGVRRGKAKSRSLAPLRDDNDRDATTMGFLAQLPLKTVPGVQKEYQAIRAHEARQARRKSIAQSRAAR